MGQHQAAVEDAMWIWDKREDPDYKKQSSYFVWAAFLLGKFTETTSLVEPLFESARAEDRFDARLLSGLSSLALGDFKLADEHLSKALEECDNPRLLQAEMIMELELLQQRASREAWPNSTSITAHINEAGGILDLAKKKKEEMKTYKADPVKELQNVIASPVTGNLGSWSWLAAQAGLGRLHLEADQREAAIQAYQALSLYPQQVPEARIGLNKVLDQG
jgi:tetratricopeptide (TPR) repeat protein